MSPYQLCIAYADRAVTNGAEILLEKEVVAIENKDGEHIVKTNDGEYGAKYVVNCAGAHGASVNDMAGAEHFDTTYRRGDYFVLYNTRERTSTPSFSNFPRRQAKECWLLRPRTETLYTDRRQ